MVRSPDVGGEDSLKYAGNVTNSAITTEQRLAALEDLAPEDRVWIADRLDEYAELLEYLHDH